GQVGNQACDIVGCAEAQVLAEEVRHGLATFLCFYRSSEVWDSFGHFSGGHRNHGIGGYPGTLHLQCPGAHHAHNACLGCGVVALAEVAALSGGRANGDNAPGNVVFLEVAVGFTHAREGAAQMDVDHQIKVYDRHLQQRLVSQYACVGKQDVQTSEVFDSPCNQSLRGLG